MARLSQIIRAEILLVIYFNKVSKKNKRKGRMFFEEGDEGFDIFKLG